MRLQCDADDGELSVAQLASRGAGGTEDEVAEGGGVRGRDVGRDASGRWDGGGSRRPIPASSITAAPDFIKGPGHVLRVVCSVRYKAGRMRQ